MSGQQPHPDTREILADSTIAVLVMLANKHQRRFGARDGVGFDATDPETVYDASARDPKLESIRERKRVSGRFQLEVPRGLTPFASAATAVVVTAARSAAVGRRGGGRRLQALVSLRFNGAAPSFRTVFLHTHAYDRCQ